ncbi:hypothetical protein [Nocardia carnea]|uniref:hypothetical protein n=1 Tax=Nocardia carnea TaxID=37328 RepID=UPI002453D231|nr:hypothetical protein [Nocardia carnea]
MVSRTSRPGPPWRLTEVDIVAGLPDEPLVRQRFWPACCPPMRTTRSGVAAVVRIVAGSACSPGWAEAAVVRDRKVM